MQKLYQLKVSAKEDKLTLKYKLDDFQEVRVKEKLINVLNFVSYKVVKTI